jgi:hypothetical protein
LEQVPARGTTRLVEIIAQLIAIAVDSEQQMVLRTTRTRYDEQQWPALVVGRKSNGKFRLGSPLRRLFTILLLTFQFWLLNVFIPGHTRGRITLGARCMSCTSHDDKLRAPCAPADKPSPSDKSQCAVCYFAAHIASAPPPTIAPAPSGPAMGSVGVTHIARPEHRFARTHLGRDPPAA